MALSTGPGAAADMKAELISEIAKKDHLKKQIAVFENTILKLRKILNDIPRDTIKTIDEKANPIYRKMRLMPLLESEQAFIDFFDKNFGPVFLNIKTVKATGEIFFPRNADYYEYMDAYAQYDSLRFDVITSTAKAAASLLPADDSSKEVIAYCKRRITLYQTCIKEYKRQAEYLLARIGFESEQDLALRKQLELLAPQRENQAAGSHAANPNILLPPPGDAQINENPPSAPIVKAQTSTPNKQ